MNALKTTVIFHSADFDGIFCREIARKFLPGATLIGWDFADNPVDFPKEGQVYILDLPPEKPFGRELAFEEKERVIWIDHHAGQARRKRMSEKYRFKGYRIDGVAACRLAWQWFEGMRELDVTQSDPHNQSASVNVPLPTKQDFIDRKVIEPLAVRLAGEYDIWDKRDARAELFQYGLCSRELNNITWKYILGNDRVAGEHCVSELLENGKALQYAKAQENADIVKSFGFTFQWEGLTWLACNHARYNSHLFTAALKPEHDACFGFKFTGHCAGGKPCEEWSVSLYHAPGKEHHDLSVIAVKHGGGGHRGACGFQTEKLPFLQ